MGTITNNKLISILGTTATGKTDLALQLADKFLASYPNIKGIAIISADSRQIYQGLEILSGADIPATFIQQKNDQAYHYWRHQTQPITWHGTAIIKPNQDWSLTHFRELAIKLIKQSWQSNWLPIIIGGTGLYHYHLFNNDPDIYVQPDEKWRKKATQLTVLQLQEQLKKLDHKRFTAMNQSDQKNPRRLIRAIEIIQGLTQATARVKNRAHFDQPKSYAQLILATDQATLDSKIKKRVKKRFINGAIQEIESLLALKLKPNSPSLTTTGVKPLTKFLQKEIPATEALRLWTTQEIQYSKRQLTWLKKYAQGKWFNPQNENCETDVWSYLLSVLKF